MIFFYFIYINSKSIFFLFQVDKSRSYYIDRAREQKRVDEKRARVAKNQEKFETKTVEKKLTRAEKRNKRYRDYLQQRALRQRDHCEVQRREHRDEFEPRARADDNQWRRENKSNAPESSLGQGKPDRISSRRTNKPRIIIVPVNIIFE